MVQCFGETRRTEVGDTGKTYACVWDQAFSFQKKMVRARLFDRDMMVLCFFLSFPQDVEEFSKESIVIRIEDYKYAFRS